MRKTAVTLLFLFGILFHISSQTTNLREAFLSAESYFLFEEFDEALPLYLLVHRESPDNDNVNYKIGVCYLNNPYEKSKSIFFLEKAVQNISLKYKDNNFKETSAPLEALFYLGSAYRINNQFDDARKYYEKFLSQLDPKLFDTEMVKEQIEVLNTAENLMKRPVDMNYQILSETINTRFSDNKAVISGNENHLVFVSKLQFYDAVFYSEKINGEWSEPRNIIPELGVDGDVYPTCLSWDGTELYIYRSDDFIGNIYVSKLSQGKWGPISKLNENINTKYWESHASINREGNKLYFTSNRPGGFGGLDIYVSDRYPNGTWGTPVNLGPVINTKYNEETPFITEDGKKLYFSSYGHHNMGGYDVFKSIRKNDGTWAEPRNLGYPVNTTDDDLFYHPYRNGRFALYSRYKDEGFGRHDIYNYQVYSDEFPRMYLITGHLDYSGEETTPSDVLIRIIDTKSRDTLISLNPEAKGNFQFEVPLGTYDMVFDSKKFQEHVQRLVVPQNTPHTGMTIPGQISLIPIPPALTPAEIDRLLTLRDTLIHVDSDKTTRLRFNAERGSTVTIDAYNDGALIATDTIDAARRRDAFEFNPQPGSNIVEFKVVDKDGNTVTKTAEVIFDKPDIPEKGRTTDDKVKEEEKTTPKTIQDQITDNIQNDFQDKAEGNLKKFLEESTTGKEGFKTTEELISYLRENAGKNGYTADDVNHALLKIAYNGDLSEIIRKLASLAEGNLQKTLLNLDPQKENIQDFGELVEYLIHNAQDSGYTEEDVHDLLKKYFAFTDAEIFLRKLISISEGEMNKYLKTINLLDQNILNRQELIRHLLSEADKGVINKEEIIRLMLKASEIPSSRIIPDLKKIATPAMVKLFEEAEKDNTIIASEHVFDFLLNAAPANPEVSVEEILDLFSNYLQNIQISLFINTLAEKADGGLKNILSQLDPGKEGIRNISDLTGYLLTNADKFDYTAMDVFNLIHSVLGDENLKDFISRLLPYTRENLREFLQNLDTDKAGIRSIEELIDYLLAMAPMNNYTEDDVWDAILKMITSEDESSTEADLTETEKEGKTFMKNLLATGGIFIVLGLIILLIIWWERKKKKKEKTMKGDK